MLLTKKKKLLQTDKQEERECVLTGKKERQKRTRLPVGGGGE